MLLVRADGIGDALVCAPLLAALQAAGHAVGAVLGMANRTIFAGGALARVHALDRVPWPAHGSTPASRAQALGEVRAARYDVAIVASEEIEAYTFARDAGIAARVGFVNGWSKPLKSLQVRTLLTRAIVRPASATRAREHEVETLFRLGAGFVTERMPTRDVARLRALVLDPDAAEPHLANDVRPIVVQATAKFVAAGLDRAAFVACARRLRARGDDVLVVGDDARLLAEIARASDARSAGLCDVATWKRTIAGARALVTGDSGAAHIAGMTGVPTVDAFAPGAATAYDIRRWSPWAAPYRALVLDPSRPAEATGRALVTALDEVLAASPVCR